MVSLPNICSLKRNIPFWQLKLTIIMLNFSGMNFRKGRIRSLIMISLNMIYQDLIVLLQAYYKIEYLFKVTPKVFFPPPKVYSAVLRLTRNSVSKLECDEILFFNLVKACFNQRRKTIKNSIRKITTESLPHTDLMIKRPEQLSVEQFVELTQIIQRLSV